MEDEIELADYVVTCTTTGCGNGNIPIHVQAPATDPLFICGVCAQTITDTAPVNK